MDKVVELQDVHKSFGNQQVLRGLNLTIQRGEVFAILGHNGAGKTTTCRLIQGLYNLDSGVIKLDGETFISSEKLNNQNYKVGVLSEELGLYENLSIKENLFLYGRLYGMKKNRIKEQIAHYLPFFDLKGLENDLVQSLSRGMKKKVAILRTIIHEPVLAILDEPLNGLDPVMAQKVCDLIRKLKQKKGMTTIITSHHLDEVERIVDDYVIIKNGIEVAKKQSINAFYVEIEIEEGSVERYINCSEEINQNMIGKVRMEVVGNRIKVEMLKCNSINEILKELINYDVMIRSVNLSKTSLKEVYMNVGV